MTQYSEIKAVCDELHQAGTPITLATLLERVDGDRATVLEHYRQWRSEDRSARPQDSQQPTKVTDLDIEFSEQFIHAFKAQTQAFADAQVEPVQAQLDEMREAEQLAIQSLEDLQQNYDQLAEQNEQLQQQVDARQSQLDEQAAQLAEQTQNIEQLHQQAQDTEQEHQQKLAGLQQRIENFNNDYAALAQERDEIQRQHDELNHQHQQLEELKAQLDASVAQLQAQLEEQQPLVDKLKNENNLLKEQSAVAAKHQASQREDIRQLREQNKEQGEQLGTIQSEAEQAKQDNEKLHEQVRFLKTNSASTIERLTASNEQYQHKIKELEEQLVAKDSESADTVAENKRLKEQITFLKQNSSSTLERLSKSATLAQSRLGELELSLAETHAELERLRSEEDGESAKKNSDDDMDSIQSA
ncbi:chromosome segregation protein [Pseudoalteromonas sp. THAF3]|uniref:DNA-binding protein n=1 Tax=Pseudoalteromonas sp. THAF3 TaxID=2587843 RepID=UPI0012690F0A|nr:DNA-binding protein [Pseudoalteromonas sp. THAF3]QFU04636.1 chromosome segregation protein [Pseudoalteromonas sp. THAF3]